ncbi:MAG: hypothetical protein FWG40_00550 [Peptococcaceae bacterium]|nr:hypothetical protein [Peptococcaceae bacterium]
MLKTCMIEACQDQDRGSIGAFYVAHHAELAGYKPDFLRSTKAGYDVEMISVHHCNDFARLAAMPKKAKWRIVGGHPMQNNPRPAIPYADVICVGEAESWIKEVLPRIDADDDIEGLRDIPGTIICRDWKVGSPIPKANIENPLPDNPPYLNRPGTRSAAWYIEFARGCPYACHYCELGHSTPYRPYDIDHLKAVIDKADTTKTRKINPYAPDEASVPRYQDLYDYLNIKGYNAGFASMRVDSVLKNLPNVKMNQLIRVGIDGLTEETRFRVKKKITDQMIYDYFKTFVDRGHVQFKMFMIVGYPWDTMEDFEKWEWFMERVFSIPLKKNVSLRIKWTPFIPQPCTPLAKEVPNYTWDMYLAIEKWHSMYRRPRIEPGWFVENDGLMGHKAHKRQCGITAGDERFFVSEYEPLHVM